jgi:uridine kinase
MKSIILAGASRSGKTTLARRLQKETGFSFISADALICTFEHIYPQLNIQHNLDFECVSNTFEPFLIDYIEHLRLYQNIFYILDIFHLMPEQIAKHQLHEKCHVAFMGYPRMDAEEKLPNISCMKNVM